MPEDKLPIPQFAARIKQKYPQYKDVEDTLLVQKIVAKYPEYESQVDFGQPVKKKVGLEGYFLRSKQTQKPFLAKQKDSELPTTSKTEEVFTGTPAEIDPNDPVKSYLQPDRDFLSQIREQRRTVESVGQNQVERMSISNMVNAAKQKEKEVIEGVFPTGKDAKGYLFKVTGTNPDKLTVETLDKLTDPNNETQRLAKEKYLKLRSVEEDLKISNTFEQLALKQAAKKGGVTKKQIDEFGETLPKNMKGELVLQLLNNPDLYEAAENNQKLRAEIDEQTYALPERYPATAIKYMAQMVSKEREERGENNGILNVPSESTTTEIINDLVKQGKLPSNYLNLYNKKGVSKIVTSNLKTPGLIENVLLGAEQGVMGIGKSAAEITGIRSLYKDKKDQTWSALADQYQQFAFKPKGVFHEAMASGGNIVGQVLPMVAGGSALRASNLLKSDAATNILMTGLQTYGYNLENARTQLPGESSWKQEGLALTNTGIEMALANVFNDLKFARGLAKSASPEIREVIENFTNKSITSAAAKTQLTTLLEKLVTAGKNTLKVAIPEANEEAATQWFQNTANKVFGGEQLSDKQNFDEAYDVWKTTFLGSLLLGAGGAAITNYNQPTTSSLVYDMASNPGKYRELINNYSAIDEEIAATKNEKLSNLEFVEKKLEELDKQNIPEKEKAVLLEKALKQKVAEETGFLATLKEKAADTEQQNDIQYFIDKAGEAPAQYYEKYGTEITNKLLQSVPTETLKSNLNTLLDINPDNPNVSVLDKLIEQREPTEVIEDQFKGDPEQISQPIELSVEPKSEQVGSVVPQFTAKSDKHFEYVPIEEVDAYKEFDRETEKKFDKKELDDLTEDIRKNGIKTPIKIQVDRNGNALIVEGNTRLAAAKRLGIKNIPVEITEGEFGGINKSKAKPLPDIGRGELQRRQQTELGLKDMNGAYSKGFSKVEPREQVGSVVDNPSTTDKVVEQPTPTQETVTPDKIFDIIDEADRTKISKKSKAQAVSSALEGYGDLGAKALEIYNNFDKIVQTLKDNKKIEVKCP